jgi:hypothetical protein
MENNVAEFKKSQYLTQAVKELVNHSVLLSRQIKGIDCTKIKADKPQAGDPPAQD